MLFPKGRTAKLCRLRSLETKWINFKEILNKFKLQKPQPVICLTGARFSNRQKFYAGIARAAYKTGAIIVDSGVRTGIETYVERQKVELMGVCPEKLIKYPKINTDGND